MEWRRWWVLLSAAEDIGLYMSNRESPNRREFHELNGTTFKV